MQRLLAIGLLLLLAGCSTSPSAPVASTPSPTPSPAAATTSTPSGKPACTRTTISVKLDTYEECILDGMSYIEVANIIGSRGEQTSKAGSTETWQWNDGVGRYLTATFANDKLVSKSQVGLVRP